MGHAEADDQTARLRHPTVADGCFQTVKWAFLLRPVKGDDDSCLVILKFEGFSTKREAGFVCDDGRDAFSVD